MGSEHQRQGRRSEQLASAFLRARGCVILARNLRAGPDEVDLLVVDDGVVAAVEVKSTGRPDVDPLDAVDDRKLERIGRAISQMHHGVDRIDLLGINRSHGRTEVRWLVDVGPFG